MSGMDSNQQWVIRSIEYFFTITLVKRNICLLEDALCIIASLIKEIFFLVFHCLYSTLPIVSCSC